MAFDSVFTPLSAEVRQGHDGDALLDREEASYCEVKRHLVVAVGELHLIYLSVGVVFVVDVGFEVLLRDLVLSTGDVDSQEVPRLALSRLEINFGRVTEQVDCLVTGFLENTPGVVEIVFEPFVFLVQGLVHALGKCDLSRHVRVERGRFMHKHSLLDQMLGSN